MKKPTLQRRLRRRRPGVFFQPILELTSGALAGHEALGRTAPVVEGADHAEPEELIEIAHQRRALAELLHFWHVDAAASFACVEPSRDGSLWLHVDARVVESPMFEPGTTERMLDLHGVPRERVVVELSEPSGDLSHPRLAALIRWFRGMGIAVALDKFGSAPDSAWAISAYRPAYVKLAPHLVQGIGHDTAAFRAVRAILRRCWSTGVTPVAVGIETLFEIGVLLEAGVRMGQGMLLGAPLPLPQIPSPRVRDTLTLLSKGLPTQHDVRRSGMGAHQASGWERQRHEAIPS